LFPQQGVDLGQLAPICHSADLRVGRDLAEHTRRGGASSFSDSHAKGVEKVDKQIIRIFLAVRLGYLGDRGRFSALSRGMVISASPNRLLFLRRSSIFTWDKSEVPK